MRFGLKEEKTY